MRRLLLVSAAIASATAAVAGAAAPPVGSLPPGPHSRGELVAVALPHRSGGRVWRVARAFDAAILHQVSEADVGSNVGLVFKTTHAGRVTLYFAFTRGERTKALESRTFNVQVR
jgi:hypothetical protein